MSNVERIRASRSLLVSLSCVVIVAILSVWLTSRQMGQMLIEERVSLNRYLSGTAHRPFCYRVLVPTLLRLLTPVLPQSPCADWGRKLTPPAGTTAVVPDDPRVYVVLFLMLVFFLLVYAAISGAIYRRFFSCTWYAPYFGSIGALVFLVPIVTRGIGHLYDFSVLMFFAAMVLSLAEKRLRIYLALFALSCLNKETTVLMTFAYCACMFDSIPRRQFVLYLLLQAVIFLAVYATLRHQFRNNAGANMEVWLYEQIQMLSRRWKTLAFCGLIAVLVAYRWSEKPQSFRRMMVMLVPHLALCFYGAFPGELRNLYESVPLLALFSLRGIELALARWAPRLVQMSPKWLSRHASTPNDKGIVILPGP